MNKTNSARLLILVFAFFIFLTSAVSVSALSLIAEFENGESSTSILPGESAGYYVLATADQDLKQMNITGKLYDVTTGTTVLLGTLFFDSTSETFYFPSEFTVSSEDYNELPGDYMIEIKAEEKLTTGYYTSKTVKLNLEVEGNRLPVADFVYSPHNISTETEVTFTSTSYDTDGYLVKQEWFVDSVKIGSGSTIKYTFPSAGEYLVTLTVTDNDGGKASASKTISVWEEEPEKIYPVAAFNYVPSAPYNNETVIFTSTSYDTDGYIVKEEWDLNNDGIFEVSGNPVSKLFSQAGTYKVTLKVTDNDGLQASASKTITVKEHQEENNAPVADFVYVPSTNITTSTLVTFTSTSYDSDGTIVSYVWKIDGAAAGTGSTITKTFASTGIHIVSLTVTDNDGASDTETKQISVVCNPQPPANNPPVADFIYTPKNITTATLVTFTSTSYDTDGYIVKQEWYVDSMKISEGGSLIYQFANAGTHTVKLVVTDDDGATDSHMVSLYVSKYVAPNCPPVAGFTYLPSAPYEGDNVVFTSTSYDSDGTIVSYVWRIDGVVVSNTATMTNVFADAGTYSVSLKVTDDDGASATATKNIVVLEKEEPVVCEANAVLKISGALEENKKALLDGSDSTVNCDATINMYNWKIYKGTTLVGELSTVASSITYKFTDAGRYRVVLTIYASNGLSDSDEKTVNIGQSEDEAVRGEDDGLYVDYFDVVGSSYGVVECGEEFVISATVSNDRDEDIEDLRITFAIPEIGYEIKSEAFDLDDGETRTISMYGYLDYMAGEIDPGEYYSFIGASDTDTIRVKYFPLIINSN